MKVFVDCRWFSQPGQGVVTYLVGLHAAAEAMYESSNIEFWYGLESREVVTDGLIPENANILYVGRRGLLWRLFVMPIYLMRHGFDAAHFQYICPLYKLSTKYVTTIHDVLFFEFPDFFTFKYKLPRRILFALSARLSDVILTVSEQSAAAIGKYLRPTQAPAVIYNSFANTINIPKERQVPVESLRSKEYLLTVGRVEPRKNYPGLIHSFNRARIHEQGAKLAIVGFCSPEFKSELDSLKGTPGVLILDRVTDEQLSWLYHNSKGFIYPSFCEGFGIPVLEALSANIPCAVSDTFPIADIISQIPLRFNPRDLDAMTAAINQLWFGKTTSPDVSLKKYTWENSAEKYIEELSKLRGTCI
jgi:glycosyltransferase involved in cell wall biosynthesis